MKKRLKILVGVVIFIYALSAMFLTACLLNYNDYKITEFGNKSLIIVNEDTLEGSYKKGSLLIVDKNAKNVDKVDNIIFYNTKNNEVNIAISKVIGTEVITEKESTYTVEGNVEISSQYLIGSTEDVKVVPYVGSILGILESRVGFLIFIIFPITLAFLYEIYVLVNEIKETKKEAETEVKKEKVTTESKDDKE